MKQNGTWQTFLKITFDFKSKELKLEVGLYISTKKQNQISFPYA